jgi:tetratricopeptide (TPR) repeat protein
LILEDYEVSRELLGEEHPDILPTMSNLGKVYIAQKKYAEAVQVLEKAVTTSKKVMPPGFFGTGITLQAYGEALAGVGRDRDAERALLEAYAILLPAMGADHPGVSKCAGMLAGVYERSGRMSDAALWRSRVKAES